MKRPAAIIAFPLFFLAALLWRLPETGPDAAARPDIRPDHRAYAISSAMRLSEAAAGPVNPGVRHQQQGIASLLLTGVYGTPERGFAMVARKNRPDDTAVVAVGEAYAGYRLEGISANTAHFGRQGRRFALTLPDAGVSGQLSDRAVYPVRRSEIERYRNDLAGLRRQITLSEVTRDGQIEGFRIVSIKPGSRLQQLGILPGDLLVAANARPLDSYDAAMRLWKELERRATLDLVIERDNRRREIRYELQ